MSKATWSFLILFALTVIALAGLITSNNRICREWAWAESRARSCQQEMDTLRAGIHPSGMPGVYRIDNLALPGTWADLRTEPPAHEPAQYPWVAMDIAAQRILQERNQRLFYDTAKLTRRYLEDLDALRQRAENP